MKPVHLLVVVAMLAVGALLIFSLESERSRNTSRSGDVVAENGDGPREGGGERAVGESQRRPPQPEGEVGVMVLVRADGKPVEGARVVLTGPRIWRGTTNKNGLADAGWLAPGRYAVQASDGARAAAEVIELTTEDREITLSLAAAIALRGTVRAADGTPVAGARIEAEPAKERGSIDGKWRISWANAGSYPPVFAETKSDETGAYELLLPGAGEYQLRVMATGFGGAGERARRYDEPVSGLDFFLQPGGAVDGIVLDETEQPLAGALVSVSSNARRGGGMMNSLTQTDADGRFAITAPLGGWTNMTVRARGYAVRRVGIIRPPTSDLRVTLQRGLVLRARFVLKDSGGQPAGGVEVMLATGTGSLTATSDEDGRVEFQNISDGSTSPGGRARRNITAGGGGFAPFRKSLGQQQAIEGVIDAGELEISRGATVRGRVTNAATGEAVGGATVQYFSMTAMQFTMMPISTTQADEQGRYELTGVPQDTVYVYAAHADYASAINRRELFMRARDPKNRLLAPGQMLLEYDIQITPGAVIHGTVVDGDAKPVAGALVSGPPKAVNPGTSATPNVVSDTDGRFSLPGYATDSRIQIRAHHRDHGASKPLLFTVGSAEEPTLELVAPARLAGVVRNEAGEPVAHVRVVAKEVKQSGRGWAMELGSGISDDRGRYFIRGVTAGERKIRFDHAEHSVLEIDVTVPDGAKEIEVADATLSKGAGLSGRVTDAESNALAGIMVSIRYEYEKGAQRQRGGIERTMQSVTSDAEGRFAMWGLKQGNFRVTASVPGSYSTSVVAASGSTDVTVVVKQGARVRGRVMCDGEPVAGAWIRASQSGAGRALGLASATSAKDGSFELGPLPPEDPFKLSITHNEYRSYKSERVTASAVPAEFVLDGGLAVTGSVVDSDGAPIANASVSLAGSGGSAQGRSKWASTDKQGKFRLGGLDEGRYTVRVNNTPSQHVRGDPIETEAGGSPIKFVLSKGGTIKGKLVLPNSEELTMALVTAIDADGKTKATAWIWEGQGLTFTLNSLKPGSYTIKVTKGWGENAKQLAEVTGIETGETKLEIRISE